MQFVAGHRRKYLVISGINVWLTDYLKIKTMSSRLRIKNFYGKV